MQKNKIASITFIILGIIFFTVPIIDYIDKESETNNYDQTICKIIELKRIKSKRPGIADKFILKYEYTVKKNIYISNRFSNGVGDIGEFEIQFPQRTEFPVFYDPENPEESVLVIGGRKFLINAPLIAGFILTLFGIIGLLSNKYKILKSIWDSLSG